MPSGTTRRVISINTQLVIPAWNCLQSGLQATPPMYTKIDKNGHLDLKVPVGVVLLDMFPTLNPFLQGPSGVLPRRQRSLRPCRHGASALARKIPLNLQWAPRWATTAPRHAEKASTGTPNVLPMAPKGELGTSLGPTFAQIRRKTDVLWKHQLLLWL